MNQDLPIVGILGDGQLAMMMAEAYQKLGGQAFIYAASNDGPASHVANKVFVGSIDEETSIASFFKAVDVVTLENEFNDGQRLVNIAQKYSTPLYPDPSKFKLIEDKLSEKQFFESMGVTLANYCEIKTAADIPDTAGYLKLAKGGYDGIGTYRVQNQQEAKQVYDKLKQVGTVLFEQEVDFKTELSLIAAADGEQIVFYPLVETHQENGTCRLVNYPCDIDKRIEDESQKQVKRILESLDTKGVFAFEFFLTQDDQLILNESAPRPHNSGHITLDLVDCSQFENHMRAVSGIGLKQPQLKAESMTMVNLLGTKDDDFNPQSLTASIKDSESSVTLYNKKKSRIKRKMGHINLWGADQQRRARHLIETLEV